MLETPPARKWRSEELPSERTEWLLPKPLKRGEVYAWNVVAVVDGKEISSPVRRE